MPNSLPPNIRFRRRLICFLLLIFLGVGGYKLLTYSVTPDFVPSFSQKTSIYVASGEALIMTKAGDTRELSAANEREGIVQVGDMITSSGSSFVEIRWGDIGVTRLAPESRVVITEAYYSTDTRISLDVLSGQVWNHVAGYVGPNGALRVGIPSKKLTASVRGSAFEVNIPKGYLYSAEHIVAIDHPSFSRSIGSFLVGQGRLIALNHPDESLASSVRDLAFSLKNEQLDTLNMERLQEVFYDQYLRARAGLPIAHRLLRKLQSSVGIDPDRYAPLRLVRDNGAVRAKIYAKALETRSTTQLQSLHSVAYTLPDMSASSELGAMLINRVSPEQSAKYVRDIAKHSYFSLSDQLLKGTLPPIAGIKMLFTQQVFMGELQNISHYFASYSPEIQQKIKSQANKSSQWKSIMEVIENFDPKTAPQEIEKILPGEYFPAIFPRFQK